MKNACVIFTGLFLILMNSCGQREQNATTDISSMSDEDKQALLEEEYRGYTLPSGIYSLLEDSLYEDSILKASTPILIPTSSSRWIYGYFETDLDSVANKIILCYDIRKDSLFLVQPSVIVGELYIGASQYLDYKVTRNHLYLIHQDYRALYNTYQPYTIFYIDVRDGSFWYLKELGGYGEKTEFIDDKIKAQVFYETKEPCDDNNWEWEYADSIRWIKME